MFFILHAKRRRVSGHDRGAKATGQHSSPGARCGAGLRLVTWPT